jgi:hypothetical protein
VRGSTLKGKRKQEPAKSDEWAKVAFPLHLREEFEVPLNQMGIVVGVNLDYPAAFREMLSAAAITYQLQNKSIDNVRRTYLKDMHYEEDPGGDKRLDRAIRSECAAVAEAVGDFLRAYPPLMSREPLVGEWIADLTILRVGYSIERAFAEADKGALYESVTISRMALEQCCWAYAVAKLDDVEQIRALSVGRCVSLAKADFPNVARFYGWLSSHAHWNHRAHVKALVNENDRSAIMLASNEFKALAYCALLIVTTYYRDMVDYRVRSMKSRSLTAVRSHWRTARRRFQPRKWLSRIGRQIPGARDVTDPVATLSRAAK